MKPVKLPKEINADGPIPFLGSQLKSQKKEVMIAALVKAAQKNNKWEKIRPADVREILEQYTAYNLGPQACWNAFHEMGKEGALIIGKDKEGAFVEITEQAIVLATSKS